MKRKLAKCLSDEAVPMGTYLSGPSCVAAKKNSSGSVSSAHDDVAVSSSHFCEKYGVISAEEPPPCFAKLATEH